MNTVEQLIRDAKPASPGALNARAEADLAAIVASIDTDDRAWRRAGRQRHRGRWAAAVSAGLVVALTITGVSLLRPQPSYLVTPALAQVTPLPTTVAAELGRLQQLALAQPDRSGRTQTVLQWWVLPATPTAVVKPVTTTGPAPATEPVITITGPPGMPDIVLGGATAGSTGRRFVSAPPTDAAEFGPYLAGAFLVPTALSTATPTPTVEPAFAPALPYSDSPAVTALSGLAHLLMERQLTPAQTGAALGYLASLTDLQLVGTSTDQLGRSVVLVAAPPGDDVQFRLGLSPDTGAILSWEVLSHNAERDDLPLGALVEYVVWDA
jgi:hypothetical protein